jgi:hypothetical protein
MVSSLAAASRRCVRSASLQSRRNAGGSSDSTAAMMVLAALAVAGVGAVDGVMFRKPGPAVSAWSSMTVLGLHLATARYRLLCHPQLHQRHRLPPQSIMTTEEPTSHSSQQPRHREVSSTYRKRLSPANRNSVLKLSSSYRNPVVKPEPGTHRSLRANCWSFLLRVLGL